MNHSLHSHSKYIRGKIMLRWDCRECFELNAFSPESINFWRSWYSNGIRLFGCCCCTPPLTCRASVQLLKDKRSVSKKKFLLELSSKWLNGKLVDSNQVSIQYFSWYLHSCLQNDIDITVIVITLNFSAKDRFHRVYGSFKKTSSFRLHKRIRSGQSIAIFMKNKLPKRHTE